MDAPTLLYWFCASIFILECFSWYGWHNYENILDDKERK